MNCKMELKKKTQIHNLLHSDCTQSDLYAEMVAHILRLIGEQNIFIQIYEAHFNLLVFIKDELFPAFDLGI